MTNYISETELLQLVKKLNSDPIPDQSQLDWNAGSDDDGWVEIQNNRIIVHDPIGKGKAASIRPIHPLKLKVNHVAVETEQQVFAGDLIQWEIEESRLFQITVSEDKMRAFFHLIQKHRYSWKLKDKEKNHSLAVEAEEDHTNVLHTVDRDEVVRFLKNMSIVNFDVPVIEKELETMSNEPVLIAAGTKPIPGTDARLELFFTETLENSFEEIGGVVDFRNHLKIPSAKKGEVIARKINKKEGVKGVDVFGAIVKPEPAKDLTVLAKDHVKMGVDGEFVALKDGRPRITGDTIKLIDITPTFVVAGNVDIKTGNIVFSGDVVVYGDVAEGMIIEALGNVYVFGNVYHSTITATGSIEIKGNIIGSKLYCGYYGVLFNRLYKNSKQLNQLLLEIRHAAKQLTDIVSQQGKTVKFGQVYMLLIESKFNEIPSTVKEILICISNIQNIHRGEYDKLKEKLEIFLHPLKLLELDSAPYMLKLEFMLNEVSQSIERSEEYGVHVNMSQCHLSEIKSNGNIFVRGEGVLKSNLYAKRNIAFYHFSSVCRGAMLEAGGIISAMIVGGEAGSESELKAGEKVMLAKMYYGRICIGKYCTEVLEPIEHVTLYTQDDRLVINEDKIPQ